MLRARVAQAATTRRRANPPVPSRVRLFAASQDALANYPGKRAVISMSLGGGGANRYDAPINRAVAAGIVVSVAAGNENTNACTKSPASTPAAITVMASDSQDWLATFSNNGGTACYAEFGQTGSTCEPNSPASCSAWQNCMFDAQGDGSVCSFMTG